MAGEYDLDFRAHPEAYRYRSGEQGVFKVQPYKDELLPDWSFKDEAAAEASVKALREQYESYRASDDFVGMDMVRKYLRMGFTRAMRYAKYPGGQKYNADGTELDATCNWWGSPDGPEVALANPPSTTDSDRRDVLGPVDFDPWLIESFDEDADISSICTGGS